jgi:hypothetical protein
LSWLDQSDAVIMKHFQKIDHRFSFDFFLRAAPGVAGWHFSFVAAVKQGF